MNLTSGANIKTKYGTGKIKKQMPEENPYLARFYEIELDNPGYFKGGTFYYEGVPTYVKAGIIFLFENEIRPLEIKQGELFQ